MPTGRMPPLLAVHPAVGATASRFLGRLRAAAILAVFATATRGRSFVFAAAITAACRFILVPIHAGLGVTASAARLGVLFLA